MDRGAWQATVHQIAKSQTPLSDWACTHPQTWPSCIRLNFTVTSDFVIHTIWLSRVTSFIAFLLQGISSRQFNSWKKLWKIHQLSCWNSCVLVWEKFNISKALGKIVSGQRILRIIDLQHLCSVQTSLVIRSVSCYLKINFSVWFSLNVASENYTHSQRPQGSQYNLNKLGMFESINNCICLHPLQHHVHRKCSGESSKKGLRICTKQQGKPRDKVKGALSYLWEKPNTLKDAGQGASLGRLWDIMRKLFIFLRTLIFFLFFFFELFILYWSITYFWFIDYAKVQGVSVF